jgi:hypothetical protein
MLQDSAFLMNYFAPTEDKVGMLMHAIKLQSYVIEALQAGFKLQRGLI